LTVEKAAMKFVLTGFSQNENIRHYSFQGIGGGRKNRTEITVGVDLSMLQVHTIPLQEAPLLCSQFLASRTADEQDRSCMLPESDMRARAEQRASEQAASQIKRKPASLPLAPQASPPQAAPDVVPRKSGIGLGSRAAYPWSPPARKSLLTGDPSQNT
jgi:hypothetical protein